MAHVTSSGERRGVKVFKVSRWEKRAGFHWPDRETESRKYSVYIYIIRYIYMYVTYNVQISYVYVYIYIHNVIDIDIIRINMLYYVICL